MKIELTAQQLYELDAGGGTVPRVIDPRNNAAYVLVSEADYETVRDILEEEQRQSSIRATAVRNAIGRMDDTP